MSETEPDRKLSTAKALKVLAICGAGLLLSAGLCGLDAHLYPHRGSPLSGVGAFLAVFSMLGMFGSFVALLIAVVVRMFRR